jgi:porin
MGLGNNKWLDRRRAATFLVSLWALGLHAEAPTNAPPDTFLLTDGLGNVRAVSTNEVDSTLHPAPGGLSRQIPATPKGAAMDDAVMDRINKSKSGLEGWQWFPSTPPVLMPYLGNLDEEGNTAIQPGAVFGTDPASQAIQAGKYGLSSAGFRYTFYQSLSVVSLSGAQSGSSALQYYTATFLGKLAVIEEPKGAAASWISTEVDMQFGLSKASRAQTPQGNLGSLVYPNDTVVGVNGIWMAELAWQQSFADGHFVVVAGLVDESNYLDANKFANNSQGQMMNSALVNSMVLPLPYNNLGVNVQWQPSKTCYVMFGTGANGQPAGDSPFNNLDFDNWSYLLEFGVTPRDVLGLGDGVYRLQPFLATVHGQTQAGVGVNFQQQLGKKSPFGVFGRFGVGGTDVTIDGAKAQVGTGIVMQAPLQYAGLFPKMSNDYLGLGFIWSQQSQVWGPSVHANEYGFEASYVLQFTPTMTLQPDVQLIWNPANHPDATQALVFQLQVNFTW